MSRTIVLHYHLFKNAGTSVDRILKKSFGDKWETTEFSMRTPDNSAEVADWIRSTPEAVAYSTHTAIGPVPVVQDVNIITLLLLRDPIARIRSAYRFERNQQADTLGAKLAKETDLEGYVRARLSRPGDRQCRNFQTHRLASMNPGPAPEITRALQAAGQISVLGQVEKFDVMLRKLETALHPAYPDFTAKAVRANTTQERPETDMDRRVNTLLEEVNADDLELLRSIEV